MVEPLITGDEEIELGKFDELNPSRFMTPIDILWPTQSVECALGATDVHLWAAHLDLARETLLRMTTTLSKEEQDRANRFHFEGHRNGFIAGRGILRTLLASYLDCEPGELEFQYGTNGKPVLARRFTDSDLSFNVAHSEDLALIAVTKLGPIGVDVEKLRPTSNAQELVERFFSVRENARFQTLPLVQREVAFFNLWTRKEAWLKATGEGIGHSLDRVEVTFIPGESARILALPEISGIANDWVLRELRPANGFVGAVALHNSQFVISNFQFPIAQFR